MRVGAQEGLDDSHAQVPCGAERERGLMVPMPTSAIRFNGQSISVNDPELREFLKALAYHLPDYARDNAATAGWLIEACAVCSST